MIASIGMMKSVLTRVVLMRPGVPKRNHRWMKILMKRILPSLKILGTAARTKNMIIHIVFYVLKQNGWISIDRLPVISVEEAVHDSSFRRLFRHTSIHKHTWTTLSDLQGWHHWQACIHHLWRQLHKSDKLSCATCGSVAGPQPGNRWRLLCPSTLWGPNQFERHSKPHWIGE